MLHPALSQLSKFQAKAKLRMFLRRLRSPRRIVLSGLALVLGVVWLSQTLIGMIFRKPADPDNIKLWIPMSLMAYGAWNVLKAFTRKPVEPFEWTPTEKEWLIAAPFSRQQLIAFRFWSIVKAAAVKAACFSLIMLPDLHILPLAFAGMFLALTFLDLIRMAAEVVAYGVSTTNFKRLRVGLLSIAAVAGFSAFVVGTSGPASVTAKATSLFGLIFKVVNGLIYVVATTAPGQFVLKPFLRFSRVILADELSLGVLTNLLCATFMILGVAWLLVRLDAWFLACRQRREVEGFENAVRISQSSNDKKKRRPFSVPARWRGVGTLMWRQAMGVFHYPAEVIISMVLPAFLSLLPITVATSTGSMFLQVVGSLVFYSFLLMPAALRFDFRRDVDRMTVLRALPFGPWSITCGQLAIPIIACTLFQFLVLIIACVISPYPIMWLGCAMLLLLPVNAVIFSLENLIFMLFPYRPNQEGVGVFMRTILTFTGKGLIFGLGVVVSIAWMFAAKSWLGGGPKLFVAGVGLMTCATAAVLTCLIVRTYVRFDPSQDTPPLS